MSEFFKSKYKLGLALSAVFLAVTLAVGSFAFLNRDVDTLANVEPEESESEAPGPEADPVETEPEPEPEPEIIQFNAPAEMRGTFLTPGVDFLKSKDTTQAAIQAEIDSAFAGAKELEINAVVVDTTYNDAVIYQTKDAPELSSDFDILAYILDKARDEGLYTYAIFDASVYESRSAVSALLAVGAGSANKLSANLEEFASKYAPDGILIDGYASAQESGSYVDYLLGGGGIGFDNFLRQSPASVVKTASKTIRVAAPGTQVGLLADAVWENQSANEEGSATTAAYTALSGGYADTKGFVEKGYVDFVAVKAYTTTESKSEPFAEVVGWWADVSRRNDIPLYVVLATGKLFTAEPGWGSADQLIRQISELENIGGVRGSIFNNLQTVASNNQNVTANLKKLYNNEVAPEQILTQLEMTKPAQTSFTTSDPQVTFTGASDPGEPVTIDGEEIKTDASGYFTVQKPLKTGLNSFVIEHKGKKVEYSITRKVEVLRSASPMDNITTEGGMSVTISAVAYQDADVYAVVNGTTVSLSVDDSVEDEQDRDGFFRIFTGQYTAPAATGEVQNLGRITVYAEYDGEKNSIQAASVKVNKKVKLEDGVAVRITTDQAITYPPNTLDNIPDARYYPLPAGAMDYAVGDEIVYKKDGKTHSYFVLASGLRVNSQDLTAISDDYPSNNAISGLSVKSESSFTYVTLGTAQKVTYSVSYASGGISFEFHNTAAVPADKALSQNPLFTAANWSGQTLTLEFAKQNGFMGYKGYYDESGNLVLRFNNPPSSLSGARIAIDPGHGGRDIGASGFLADYPESTINRLIAEALAEELTSRGATVNLMENAGVELEQRKKDAENWNADLFVSIHSNSAPNIKATGTEVYYFHPFSKTLAANTASGASGGLNTNNRGAKQSYYHVTLSSQMASALIETGFLTNQGEYEKMIKAKYHKSIAAGIADGLSATIKAHNTGISASGSESVGSAADPGGETAGTSGGTSGTSGGGSSGSTKAEAVYIDSYPNVILGVNTQLWPEFYPDETDDNAVTWKSSNTSVVEVDEAGRLTPKKEGSATVTITTKNGGQKASSQIEVQARGTSQTKLTGLELSESDLYLNVGKSHILRPVFSPEDASNKQVTFRSGSSGVATVDETGKVTAVKAGTATITATSRDGSHKATCTVTVSSGSSGSGSGTGTATAADSGVRLSGVRSLQVDEEYYQINPGVSMRIPVYDEGLNLVRGGDFTWKSDDTSVATVDSMGNVTAKKVGTAVLTATAKGHETLEWYIDVTRDKIALRSLSFDLSAFKDGYAEVKKGSSITLKVNFQPTSASNRTLTWSSSNTRYATVDANGKVTGVSPGTVTITAKSKENSKIYESVEVEVLTSSGSGSGSSGTVGSGKKIEGFYILCDDYDVSDTEYFSVGDTGELTYQYYPDSASTSGVTWESKTPSVVKVDSSGRFECLKRGSATIVLTQAGGSARASFRITVE